MENQALRTSTRSYAVTLRIDKAHIHTHTHTHKHKQVPPLPAGQCAKSDTPSICWCYSASQQPQSHCYTASHTNLSITVQRLPVFLHLIWCPHFTFPPLSSFKFFTRPLQLPRPLQVDSVYLFTPLHLPWCIEMAVMSLEVFCVWPACSLLLKTLQELFVFFNLLTGLPIGSLISELQTPFSVKILRFVAFLSHFNVHLVSPHLWLALGRCLLLPCNFALQLSSKVS